MVSIWATVSIGLEGVCCALAVLTLPYRSIFRSYPWENQPTLITARVPDSNLAKHVAESSKSMLNR